MNKINEIIPWEDIPDITPDGWSGIEETVRDVDVRIQNCIADQDSPLQAIRTLKSEFTKADLDRGVPQIIGKIVDLAENRLQTTDAPIATIFDQAELDVFTKQRCIHAAAEALMDKTESVPLTRYLEFFSLDSRCASLLAQLQQHYRKDQQNFLPRIGKLDILAFLNFMAESPDLAINYWDNHATSDDFLRALRRVQAVLQHHFVSAETKRVFWSKVFNKIKSEFGGDCLINVILTLIHSGYPLESFGDDHWSASLINNFATLSYFPSTVNSHMLASKLEKETLKNVSQQQQLCALLCGNENLKKNLSPTRDDWENYVVRNDAFAKIYTPPPGQINYGSIIGNACEEATSFLKSNQWDFFQLLSFLAYARHRANGNHTSEFGLTRNAQRGNQLFTNLIGPYEPIRKVTESWEGTIDGERVVLSTSGSFQLTVNHPNFDKLHRLMPHIKDLFDQAMSLDDERALMAKLGEVFWWICQAKPWVRGDPSIAEMVVKAILLSKGFTVYPWKISLIPWVEVMLETDGEKFGEKFSTFFDRNDEP